MPAFAPTQNVFSGKLKAAGRIPIPEPLAVIEAEGIFIELSAEKSTENFCSPDSRIAV